jgi:8-oxo-dGTP pyrophosphatase MutT (NUDIX family)
MSLDGSAAASVARPTLYLVDASLYVFRAWHSMPDEFQDADGWPTNAVHGFARFLLELLERERPRHIVVAFDEALDSCFRNAIYPAYKANRDPAPEALKRQFAHCKALCAALGLVVLAHSDYEADDLIGSAAHVARAHGHRSVIVSADKDMSQLLGEFDEQWDFAKGQRWGSAGSQGTPWRACDADRRLPGAHRRHGRQHPRRSGHRRQDGRDPARAFRKPRWPACAHRRSAVPALPWRRPGRRETAPAPRTGPAVSADSPRLRSMLPLDATAPVFPRGSPRRRATAWTVRISALRAVHPPSDCTRSRASTSRCRRPRRRHRRMRRADDDNGTTDSSETLYEGQWLRLVRRGHWESCEAHPRQGHGGDHHRLHAQPMKCCSSSSTGCRSGARTIEMPAGLVGDDHAHDTLESAARRELIEETGWEAATVEVLLIGPTSSGMSNERIAFVRARDLTQVGPGGGVDNEDITVHAVPRSEAPAWLMQKQREGFELDLKLWAGLWMLERNPDGSPIGP